VIEMFAWTVALVSIGLGAITALIPGFPGSVIALIGAVAFASLTGWRIVPPDALGVAALIALGGTIAQLAAPALLSRATGGTAGAATGAVVGAGLGALIPVPGMPYLTAVLGAAVGGAVGGSERTLGRIRGVIGAASGCGLAVAADLCAVTGIASVLAVCAFAARI
jgi:uncharacterized protein YqgC (DUF456 family)